MDTQGDRIVTALRALVAEVEHTIEIVGAITDDHEACVQPERARRPHCRRRDHSR